jgi:WD40 repeat protein
MNKLHSIELALTLASLVCLMNKVNSQNFTLANHTATVWSVRFVQEANGDRYLVSSSTDSKINFWTQSNSNWSLTGQISIPCQFMAPLGNQLATNWGNKILLWNVSTKALSRTYTFNSNIMEIAVSPSLGLLAVGTGNISQVINSTSGLLVSTTCCHSDIVRSLVFYSDEILVTGK